MSGAALNFVDNCLLAGFAVVRRDALLARFLLFGVVVGLTELAADAWLVARTLRRDSWRVAVVAGLAGGASILVCYTVAFLITDRLIS